MPTTRAAARLTLLFVLCATGAHAREVYKCTNSNGDVAYQDQPCARADREVMLHMADAPPVPSPAPADAAEAPAPAPPPKPAVVERPPPKPLPALWLCMNAEDGSRYVSSNGSPPPRRVPLGVLGYSGKSLAETYAAGNNVMSAPEFNKPPIDTSPRSSFSAGYTQVQDQCARVSPEQTCDILRQELDQLRDKLSHARFKDEQATLQPRVDQVEDQLGGCQ